MVSPIQSHYMYALLRVEQEMNRIVSKEGEQLDGEIRGDLKRIEAFNREKIEMLRLHAQELQAKLKWSAWQSATQYVAAATSIAVGASCIATGAASTAGAFLITSGSLGLTNRIATDTGAWQSLTNLFVAEREKQIKVAARIDFSLNALSVALSIAGTFGAYHARALELLSLSGRDPIMRQAALSLNLLNTGLTVFMKAGEGFAEKRRSNILADLKVVDLRSNTLREEIKIDTAGISRMIQLSEEIDNVLKNAISSLTL